MTTVAMADDVIASKLPDIDDDIVGDDKSVTPVSAFNSSI